MWHDFRAERVAADVRRIAAAGHQLLRTFLPWDVFMPTTNGVDPGRLRDLERLLSAAEEASLQVVPVLFVQSAGGCVMLPPYAIDVSRPRRGVRVITGGVVQPGGPRDLYMDPLMIETALLWLDTMLANFAGHGAIAWWDIGHDPAATVRPQRITHLGDWVRTITLPLRDRGERCALTLGADDLISARGVRPGVVAPQVDVLGFELDPMRLWSGAEVDRAEASVFLMQLALRLSDARSVHIHVAACELDDATADGDGCAAPEAAARHMQHVVPALMDAGCAGVFAAQWSWPGPRVAESAPFDRARGLLRRGVVDTHAESTRSGNAWIAAIRHEHDVVDASPWPPQLDVDAYYENLTESVQDLHVAWRRGRSDEPAMLS